MQDLEHGIVKIGDFVFSKNTKLEELKNLSEDIVITKTYERSKIYEFNFLEPIVCNSIKGYFKVEYTFDGNIYSIRIGIRIPEGEKKGFSMSTERTEQYFEYSKRFLKGLMKSEPTAESQRSLEYEFDWGGVYTFLFVDRDYGLRYDGIEIEYFNNN